MRASLLTLLALIGAMSPVLPAAFGASSGITAGDDLEAATEVFRASARDRDLDKRKAGLDGILAVGGKKAWAVVQEEIMRMHTDVADLRELVDRLTLRKESDERVLANLRMRAKKDDSLEDAVKNAVKWLESTAVDLSRQERKLRRAQPWLKVLNERGTQMVLAMGTSDRRSIHKDLGKLIDKSEIWNERLAGIDLLGRVGTAGAGLDLHGVMVDLMKERGRLLSKLPRAEGDALELESRMQDEAAKNGGRVGSGTSEQYNRAKVEGAVMHALMLRMAEAADACVLASSRALAREDEEARARSIKGLVRSLSKLKDGARLRTLEILTGTDTDLARNSALAVLLNEKEPAAIALLIRGMVELGGTAPMPPVFIDGLLTRWIQHEAWIVRTAAAAAISDLRCAPGVPVLIARLAEAGGRERTDLAAALRRMTGQKFLPNTAIWQRWWKDAESTFEPTGADAGDPLVEEGDGGGVTFFGIRTESQNVAFILDLSGSMNFSVVVRDNPGDDPTRPPDMPKSGERSRLKVAVSDLSRALGGLRDEATFAIIMYASDVRLWDGGLQTMNPSRREQIAPFLDGLTAVGGTNIFGALRKAFEVAKVSLGDKWSNPPIDTIFLLTDGKPSVGLVITPEPILRYVREWNRTAGIVIHTIGLSGAQDAYLLRRLAEENGGTYVAR
ncbi:MAG: VWA domain-containing protein [Planctomycetota bacterium]|nr:VWA domain-containing protein [Planctomycetota bacterium]